MKAALECDGLPSLHKNTQEHTPKGRPALQNRERNILWHGSAK